MAAKIDMKKSGGRVKGAGDLPATAKGNAPNTGAPGRTPAPDNISAPRAAHSGYGQNSYAGPSSLTHLDDANAGRSALGLNMSQTGEGVSDPILSAIISKGTAAMSVDPTGDAVTAAEGVAGTQIGKIGAKNVPDHPAMVSARARQPSSYPTGGGSIPGALTDDETQPLRKPGR